MELSPFVVQQSGLISFRHSTKIQIYLIFAFSKAELFHFVFHQSRLLSFYRLTKWNYFILSSNKVDLFPFVFQQSRLISFCRTTMLNSLLLSSNKVDLFYFKVPFGRTNMGQKAIPCTRPYLWNSLSVKWKMLCNPDITKPTEEVLFSDRSTGTYCPIAFNGIAINIR